MIRRERHNSGIQRERGIIPPSPVPEPASYGVLTAAGLSAVGIVRRGRRFRASASRL